MRTYEILVEEKNQVSGNRRHGAIYPMFTRMPRMSKTSGGENIIETIIDKITVEDGTFTQASRRIGYTGQHTTLTAKIENGIIKTESPYIEGELFSRNKYGQTSRKFRLNLETRTLQRPIAKNGVIRWYDFSPSRYID